MGGGGGEGALQRWLCGGGSAVAALQWWPRGCSEGDPVMGPCDGGLQGRSCGGDPAGERLCGGGSAVAALRG